MLTGQLNAKWFCFFFSLLFVLYSIFSSSRLLYHARSTFVMYLTLIYNEIVL